MIKTLRITAIIAAIAAALLIILPVVYGVRKDPKIDEILKSQTAVDKFTASKGQSASSDESKTSPLVAAAMAFGRYLNPPPPPQAEAPPSPTAVIETRPEVSSVKFDLIGVSFYRERPEQSYALINEPGKGLTWVKQGSNVEHLVISEIKEDSITIQDGQKTSEMKVPIQETWRKLQNPVASTTPSYLPASSSQPAAQPGQPSNIIPGQPIVQPGVNASKPSVRPRRGAGVKTPASDTANPQQAPQPNPPTPVVPAPVQQTEQKPNVINQPKVPQTPAQPPVVETPAETPAETPGMAPPPLPTEKDIIHARLMEEVKASKMTEQDAKQLEEAASTIEQLEQLEAQREAQKANSAKKQNSGK